MLRQYKLTWWLITQAPGFFLGIAVFMTGLKLLDALIDLSIGATLPAYTIVFFFIHRAVLFGETRLLGANKNPVRPLKLGRFLLVGGGLVILTIAATLAAFFAYDSTTAFQSTSETRMGSLMLTFSICGFVVLALFGTTLPSAAAADPSDFWTRLTRPLQSTPRLLGGLIVGPGLFFTIFVLGFAVLDSQLDINMIMYDPATGFDFVGIANGFLFTAISIIGGFLTVALLCDAYQRVAPDEVLAVMHDFRPSRHADDDLIRSTN